MNCPDCGQENLETARFCVKCGFQFRTSRGVETTYLSTPPTATDALREEEREPEGLPPAPPDFGQISTAPTRGETGRVPAQADTQEFKPRDFLLMVVDDTPDNLVLLSLHLQQAGFRVITASNGEEALKIAEISSPDLILIDIAMPGLDGLGATRRLREHPVLRLVPVVAVTAFSTDGFRRAAYDAGLDGYLTKPVDFERLNELVRRLLPVRRTAKDADTGELDE
ncbi:MAG TPA: response regulator [Pyrinomonadaceae bacterium]|jgi:CheY-like chemotaxis protein|nr:response regulator [Pyrinomonadaceae bacterium]